MPNGRGMAAKSRDSPAHRANPPPHYFNGGAYYFGAPAAMSFLMTLPPFITNLTRCSSVMSASGSPETATRSAYLPLSMEPI